MRLNVHQFVNVLTNESGQTTAEGRIALANAAKAVIKLGQQEEFDALKRKHERESAHYQQWIEQAFGHPAEGHKNGRHTVLDARD